jgi:pimeloyl-ACP methyl ester carboxylesterase
MKIQLLALISLFWSLAPAQQAAPLPDFHPLVQIQREDYAKARKHFQTKLLRTGPAPQKWTSLTPPVGVTEVDYPSAPLKLKAWLSQPDSVVTKHPAVLFLHGGHSFSAGDWEMSQPYRNAGFVVMSPLLRGENGQPGTFSMYHDEVADVIAAAEYLRHLPYVDSKRIFLAGHSVGGTMTMLAALESKRFRAAASLSGSPDQVLYVKYAPGAKDRAPFDITDMRELEMRSPLAYAAYFKCPLRIYYGSQEPHLELTSQRTSEIARQHHLDVQALKIEGNHLTEVPAAVKESIEFFRQYGAN